MMIKPTKGKLIKKNKKNDQDCQECQTENMKLTGLSPYGQVRSEQSYPKEHGTKINLKFKIQLSILQ